jgi:excisionase family DNA binding protein
VNALQVEVREAVRAELAAYRDARLDEVLERLAAIESRLAPILATVPEAARVLRVSPATVKRKIKTGELPTVMVGSQRRVDLAKLRGVDAEEIAQLAAAVR